MKKALLLSVVASGLIYAGGDIAPAQPVQPQVAPAACDFWGTLAFRYDANKAGAYNFGDSENNLAAVALAMGVEKELGYGFGFGAELDGIFLNDGSFDKIPGVPRERAELMQAYVTYKTGNTAFKIGRQVLPASISPLAFTERDTLGGLPSKAFNGITVVNTSLANTTLVGAWIASTHDFYENGNTKVNGVDNKGVFMIAAIYKASADTTLQGNLYYAPKSNPFPGLVSAWATAKTKVNNVDLGLQVAYSKLKGAKASFGVAGYAGTKFDAVDVKLTLAYLNDGASPLSLAGSIASGMTGEATSAFWGASYRAMGGVAIAGNKQKIARLDLGYTLANKSRIYGGVAVDKPDTGKTAIAARVGYDFTVAGMAAKVEYRYHKDFAGAKDHRIRVQAVYKF